MISDARVSSLGAVFRTLGREGCESFESVDPQFTALRKLRSCGTSSTQLAALNGLVSYVLTMRGEEFWELFAGFVAGRCGDLNSFRDCVKLVKEFTVGFNKLGLEAKLKRLDRTAGCEEAFKKLNLGDLEGYVRDVSRCLGCSSESKTVVFSAKMAYYALRSMDIEVNVSRIPIPVDRRVTLVALTSGLVSPEARRVGLDSLEGLTQDLMRRPELVRRAWGLVSKVSGVPALNLDAPLWLIGGYVKLGRVPEIITNLRVLRVTVNEEVLIQLVSELTYALRN